MTAASDLDSLADHLAREGADALRIELVRRARNFKRTWVEMAEALVEVRDTQAYLAWGYQDLYAYCHQELLLRQPTVDKLTGSFVALRRHAPAVLQRDGVDQLIPTCDAVDYFAKAMRAGDDADADGPRELSDDVLGELKTAVFEDGASVAKLRRRFNPVLYPKPDGAERLAAIERAGATAERLIRLLARVDGLSEARREQVARALDAMREDLDALAETAHDELEAANPDATALDAQA